ncbi:MAG: hypothetical protein GQ569_07195 [Methylococcaceae bacterium]|nr:hypothetical protein [Methylococcaceae bacterium]
MSIGFLEILFIINLVAISILWVWFIILGFRANKLWGLSIVFLNPVTPFMFASRFARKARRAIYYHVVVWVVFAIFAAYIQFATVDFYKTFLFKVAPESLVILIDKTKVVKDISPSITDTQEVDVKIIDDSVIDDSVIDDEVIEIPIIDNEVTEEPVIEDPIIEKPIEIKPKSKKRSYKVVNMQDMRLYIGKKVKVSTSTKKHKGKLSSVTKSSLVIKKRLSGGSTLMPIKKNKIIKIEVYL